MLKSYLRAYLARLSRTVEWGFAQDNIFHIIMHVTKINITRHAGRRLTVPKLTGNDLVSHKTMSEICIKLFTLKAESLKVHDCESIGLNGYYRCNNQELGACALCNANVHVLDALLLPVYDFSKKKIKVLLIHDKYEANEKSVGKSLWFQISKHAAVNSAIIINKVGSNSFNSQKILEFNDDIFDAIKARWLKKNSSSSSVCRKAVPRISNRNWMKHSKIKNNDNQ